MAVQFILGRSGTGKTKFCIKAIVEALLTPNDNQSLILLVPEQATYQAERAILSDRKIAGYNRLNVLSFNRLQFFLWGKNTAIPEIRRIGRQMAVHRILRDSKSKFEIFHRTANQPGLARQMANTIAELYQYANTPEDIDRLLGELQKDKRNSLTALKFGDIGLIFKEYLKFIEGKFLDPDVQLVRACQKVAKSDFVKDAKLWIDGFAGFTAGEIAILAELLKTVAETQIALCLDPEDFDLANPDIESIDPTSLFYPTQQTYAALIELVKKCKLQLAKPVILQQAVRFSSCPVIAHIEQNIFKPKPARVPAADNISIISAPNERAEVQFVVRRILELVREKDYRYRDIAVIASDIDQYEHYIRAYFEDYGVPFFIDKRRPLNQHPVVQLICSALQVVTGGFSNSDIFAYLKTDLVPVERGPAPIERKHSYIETARAESLLVQDNRCGIDLLENYCLAFGINAGDWQSDKPWDFAGESDEGFDDRQIDRIRRNAIAPLLELKDRLYPGDNPPKTIRPEEFTRIIFDFLDALQMRQTLGNWIEEATERKDYAAIELHQQLYDAIGNVFDELVEVFAGQNMAPEDYFAIINSAFSQLTLAFIPPTLDQVLVGSIERSRHPDLKAVFLIGATQKQFPVPIGSEGILTDDDRCAVESADFPLAATASQKLAERQYLAYIAFTRPSELLCITYPAVDNEGSAVPRSQFIGELESLFENLKEESTSQIEIEKVGNQTELVDFLCSRLGRDTPVPPSSDDDQLTTLLDDICSDEELACLGGNILSAINYDNLARLDNDVVEELFGSQIKSSATRLSNFAQCPYKHFAGHILELKERKESKFEPLDLGNFYHRILDALLKKLSYEKKDLDTIQDSKLLSLLRDEISKFKAQDPFTSNFIRHSQHNTYIVDSAAEVLEDCVLAIAQMVRAGSFIPKISEIAFGQVEGARDTLGSFGITLSDNRVLSLDGKIDRLDTTKTAGEKLALIFDYKRSEQSFKWSELYYGLDMQLPIYILAVRNASRSKTKNVVGAFYMPVETKLGQAAFDELETRKEKFTRKAKGIFNGEFFQQLDNANTNKFYNFFVTKEGSQYGHNNISGALRPDNFEKVLTFTERKIITLAEEMISGKIDVRPYRIGIRSPCSYCKFRAVCRFDWQINDYNLLESLDKLQVLNKIEIING
jgi:ATP-dependent helicase/nuclease subunit B